MVSVRLENLTKHFGQTIAVQQIDLAIQPGEMFFLLGPSGCGKSTLLRLIAGLLAPTSGRICFDDRDVTELPTVRRNAVMVFQSYALWPHMSVRENLRFGLKVRKLNRGTQEQRIEEMLALVGMRELADRKPNQLSGGQQQRVALARALAVQPTCLLLDEPLSNLDAKLRQEMRTEIRRICKSQGVTTIYVTHDQKEALSVADRLAVMNDGRIAQVGTPADLYYRPGSSFVAQFVGQTNLLAGRVIARDGKRITVETPVGAIRACGDGQTRERVTLSVRPEQMRISATSDAPSDGVNRLSGPVTETTFVGEASEHVLRVGDSDIRVISIPPQFHPPPQMTVEFRPQDVVVLKD